MCVPLQEHETDAETISDAFINRGNALGAAAALVPPALAVPLLAHAVDAYRKALARSPTDADVCASSAGVCIIYIAST